MVKVFFKKILLNIFIEHQIFSLSSEVQCNKKVTDYVAYQVTHQNSEGILALGQEQYAKWLRVW